MAVHIELLDITTGEILQIEEVTLNEYQEHKIDEYEEWIEIKATCTEAKLVLGIREADRKMQYIAKDFLWSMVRCKKTLTIAEATE